MPLLLLRIAAPHKLVRKHADSFYTAVWLSSSNGLGAKPQLPMDWIHFEVLVDNPIVISCPNILILPINTIP